MTRRNSSHDSRRQQTDASLRAERDKVDRTLADKLRAVDEAADAIITKARTRADQVLAATRAKTDRVTRAPGAPPESILQNQRLHEDDLVRAERTAADKALRLERAAHFGRLTGERTETDKDLLNERAHFDATLARRDEFLGIVSHDLRNMLNTMVGYAALITSEVSQDTVERVRLHAERIHRSGARMGRLIGDLVDVASIEAGALAVTRTPGDPVEVVNEAVETFQAHAAAHGVSLTVEIDTSSSLVVSLDSARILQVLVNLLSNAIKFTPPNGSVVVRLEPGQDQICFSVSDTGMGIPDGTADLIFDRFQQLNRSDRRGVGLGLYISRCIVEGHRGKIWAHSKLGEGSTFSFWLPASAA